MNQLPIIQSSLCGALGESFLCQSEEMYRLKGQVAVDEEYNLGQLQDLAYYFDTDNAQQYFVGGEVPRTMVGDAKLTQKFLKLSFQNFKLDTATDKLEVVDVSGMSNPVFIVAAAGKPDVKIIIRFFQSQAADFVMENTIFGVTSSKGLSPNIIQSDFETYRIEEHYNGSVFDYSDLSDKQVIKLTMKLLSDFNYDRDLFNISPTADLKANEFIRDQEKGWYWQAFNEIKPLFEKIEKIMGKTENAAWRSSLETFQRIDKVFFQDKEKFLQEYMELLPALNEDTIQQEAVVFCHNDTQENNLMHAFTTDANGVKQIDEVKIIDFEYSGINHRGVDLAGYIQEACINYAVETTPKYAIDETKFPNFDGPAKEGAVDVDFLVTAYLTNFYEVHLPTLIKDYQHIEKFKSLEAYLAHERPVLKAQLKGLILHQDLTWVAWCLIMTRGILLDSKTGELWEDPARLQQAIEEIGEFNMPYAATRLELYFKRRELFGKPSLFKM